MTYTQPTVPFDSPLAWSNYLDIADDIKPYLNISDITGRDAALGMIAGMAQTMIQNYLKQPIAPTTFARRYDGWAGWNGAYLYLPYRPILGTPLIVEYWGVNGAHVLAEQTPTSQAPQDAFALNRLTGQVVRTFPGLIQRPFFPGVRNIEVNWTAGYNIIPDDLKYATLELIRFHWVQSQEAGRSPAKYNSYDVNSGDTGGNMLYPGIPNRIGTLLQNYKTIGLA